jgi:hypothetical protein
MMVKDLFIQLMNIDEEAKNIVRDAKNETGTSIMRLKEEAESELAAIKKTTDLIEQQKKSTNLSKINELRSETEKVKADRLSQLKKITEKNWSKATEYGLQLMEKIK